MSHARAPWSAALLVAGVVVLAGCSTGEVEGDAAGPEPTAEGSEAVDAGGAGHDATTDDDPTGDGGTDDPTHVPPLHPEVDRFPVAQVRLTSSGPATDDGEADAGGHVELPVRVADTPDRRRRGLMQVPDLPDGTGMLFTFDTPRDGGFWMKDTLVPLDIAFADGEGRIVRILAMDPCEEDPCPVHSPDALYLTALEVPQGWFARVGVREGDQLDYLLLDRRQ